MTKGVQNQSLGVENGPQGVEIILLALNFQPSRWSNFNPPVVNFQPYVVDFQPHVIDFQPHVVDFQPPLVDFQPIVVDFQPLGLIFLLVSTPFATFYSPTTF